MKYYSQYEQDKIINEIYITNNKNGVFVDIGAHDGIFLSNSYFLKSTWDGKVYVLNQIQMFLLN